MKKYWNLFWLLKKFQLMRMMEYRGDFFFWMIVSLMWTAFNYFFFSLIIGSSNSIAGWSYDEVIILLSFFTMIDALTWSVFYPNMIDYTEEVYNGGLSKLLMLPINSIFIILNKSTNYQNVPRFFVGLTVLILTIVKIGIIVTWFQILLASLLLISATFLLYSFWFILATMSFWVERLKNINEIMPGLRNFYQMPVRIFTGITGFIVTFIFPLGLITTLPSEVVLGRSNNTQIIYLLIFTILVSRVAVVFYNYSIKKYSSVGN